MVENAFHIELIFACFKDILRGAFAQEGHVAHQAFTLGQRWLHSRRSFT
jgi:hypothetical protein